MSTRKEVLEKLSAGEIDVTRATEMLREIHQPDQTEGANDRAVRESPPARANDRQGLRWLRIHVSDLESGRHRVRVNVPLGLLKLGMKVGARFTDELDREVMQDVMEALHDQAITGTLVEVEDVDDNERVHVFID